VRARLEEKDKMATPRKVCELTPDLDPHHARLRRALEGRRLSVEAYGSAVRAGIGLDNVAAWCRETDAELTEAMAPFIERSN
jgi:hypothetical protein